MDHATFSWDTDICLHLGGFYCFPACKTFGAKLYCKAGETLFSGNVRELLSRASKEPRISSGSLLPFPDPAVCEEWRPDGAGDCSPDADGGERRQDCDAGRKGGCGEGDSHGADGPERPLLQTGGKDPGGMTSGVATEMSAKGSTAFVDAK